MFTGRQSRILEILLNNVQGMTGAKLSEHLGVSSRTIRNEVGEINRIWKEGNLIKASKRKGYFIEEQFADSVREYLLSGGRKQREEDAAGRGWMILGMTLETGRTDVFAVEEELSLSTPAVYKEVTKFQKKMVAGYQYEILQMSADRLWIEGDERKIRQFLFKLVKDETQAGTNMHVFLLRALLYRAFDQDEYEWMVRVIKEYFDSRYIQVSDANLYMVASAVYITMIRNAQNHRVVTLQDAEEIDPEIQELFRYLDENSFELDDGDRQILWGLFHGFKITANPAVEESSGSLSVLVLEDFCSEVMEKYHFDFWQSKDFYDNILIHIEYMMRRMETGYEVKNPILNDIKRQYPYAYEISMLLVPIVYRYKNCYIQDDEISFIAIFVEHFLENVNHKLKTVIISSPRFSINTIMSNWIQSNFHNQLEVTAMIPRHSLEKYLKENQVDLIISMADSIIDPVIATFKIDGIPNHYTQKAMNALIHRIRMNYRFRVIIRN